ncbi:MAG: amylo-alpha-1,6-glucosidase [Limisphaerales bacterium]
MSKPTMKPEPGERMMRFVGDFVEFSIAGARAIEWHEKGWNARLRTNLCRAAIQRKEIIESKFKKVSLAGASWRDVPMKWDKNRWVISLPLIEVGYFEAKPYAMDGKGFQHWPDGDDIGISVHPADYRTGNTIYCAFARMFGRNKGKAETIDEAQEEEWQKLEKDEGLTIIPESGTLRDLQAELPFIIDQLGCRILHLLPVSPTPTTMAKMGRFGSPYAVQDLTGIDPALVDFDKKSTGVEQFKELTYEAHRLGGKVFLDLVINHTGWGSTLFEDRPEWFIRDEKTKEFESPGAWGVKWGDLVELAHKDADLWEHLADVFLEWCRRGVDGFRCDAGYKVPAPAWQHIVARVRQEFPDAVFLLEGLGGGWDDTENLLTLGGMQWAYSELFQEYTGVQLSGYLDHALKQSSRVGLLVNYSETHDNERLAAKGREWSLMRNRLCALTSVSGGYGFTCGVEWLAPEKIKVHAAHGLNWNATDNIVDELTKLNALVSTHPCFFDGAKLKRLSPSGSDVYALWRESACGGEAVLVLVNTDIEEPQSIELTADKRYPTDGLTEELLGQPLPAIVADKKSITFGLKPGEVFCLGRSANEKTSYANDRLLASRALTAIATAVRPRHIARCDWRELASLVQESPVRFLAAASALGHDEEHTELLSELRGADPFVNVVEWEVGDCRRVTVIPDGSWLLIRDETPFRVKLSSDALEFPERLESVPAGECHICWFAPREGLTASAQLRLERYADGERHLHAELLFQSTEPADTGELPAPDDLVLLTNGRGAMSRMCVDLGRTTSKYDCVLGANLHDSLPVDRHVFVKRLRAWLDADGFIGPLDYDSLQEFESGPSATWRFLASAGDGRSVEVAMSASMVPGENTTVFRFVRQAPQIGVDLPRDRHVRLTLRFDIEDRNFHHETKRSGGAEAHFDKLNPNPDRSGFSFTSDGRHLEIRTSAGSYHEAAEWSENLPHPVEASRGMTDAGDGFSPGWFEIPLDKDGVAEVVVTAEKKSTVPQDLFAARVGEDFGTRLAEACSAFVVKRDEGKTVIAGYPWFLDWGRDTLICARGLLAAGMVDEVREILRVFGRFEEQGTLPNTIHGANASNRDTSDAQLWYGVVCEDFAAVTDDSIYDLAVDDAGRPIKDVLRSIASNTIAGTPNGIRMDPASALVWSPSHFTWMDTNYPAGTPREGYPIEIQALWIRLLRLLDRLGVEAERTSWGELAKTAEESLRDLFWVETKGWLGDCLLAKTSHIPAREAVQDQALRSNCLLAVSLGLIGGERARKTVLAARRHLVIPGALRSLAPLPATPPLAIKSDNGQLLNDPERPYWGRYEGDEDTRRKPAYHNGTAWTWPFPVYCEALACAWPDSEAAKRDAKASLASMEHVLRSGCVNHIPEVIDGDAPHKQRGCDAQAWGATEALRVWKLLS